MISHVRLENVLAFQRLDLRLARLTLLSGTNSAGKSSALHSLAVLRQSALARTLPDALLLNGELVTLGTGRDLLHSDFTGFDDDAIADDAVALRITIESAGERLVWTALYERDADTLQLLRSSTVPTAGGLFGRGFQYLQADRVVPATIYPKSHEAVEVERSLGARGEHAANFLRVHGHEIVRNPACLHPQASGRSLLEQTNAWLNELSSGTSLDVEDVEGTDLVRLVYRRAGPQVRTEPHRATNVGFGLSYALPIIVGCLAARPDELLLIENPEAHLHPRGQSTLGRLCALASAGGTQILLETHSDHVLNSVRLAVKDRAVAGSDVVIHFLRRPTAELQPTLTTIQIDESGMIESWPIGFFDEMDRALDRLLS